jgi:phenylalanyl-tRNA synthetase beta chain
MRAPLSWLREYIDINVPVEELARRLTLAGQEVEHIVRIGTEWENIYTGAVARLERHPNADRLNLATVEYGAGKEITVVTGAPNIEQGQKVVLGLVGCKYLDQHVDPPKWSTLKPAKIRGIQTEGMVMSEAELGLSEEHEGIIVLDPDTSLGLTAQEVLGDTVLVIDVTPNNGRVLSMIGIAREIAALFGGEVRYPTIEWHAAGPPAQELLSVEIHDPDLCARYSGAVIQDVKIGPSPGWMQRRLSLAGMRPINNIVDITNYVMLEMGQPLHAFDYEAVEGRKIIVRRARQGEQIETLDHVHRTLDPNMLAICDVNKPVALAGVMGGANSEIGTEGTATVLLESAHFNPRTVRRTARLLKLPSEASYRFERWVDPSLTVPAMKRAAELMRQLGGGTIAEGYADEYPRPPKPTRIHFYTDEVERLLGIPLPPSEIARMLERLEFKVDLPHNADAVGKYTTMLIDVPSYRNDVTIPADIVEEVARIVGYDIIPETMLEGRLPQPEFNRSREIAEEMRDMMLACGMDEVLTYSVAHSESLRKLTALEESIGGSAGGQAGDGAEERPRYRAWDSSRPPVTIVNPTSIRQDVMRPTMLPNMLDTLLMNMRIMPETPIRIFELGKIFITRTEQEVEQRRAEMERERVQYPRMRNWQPAPGEERMPMEARRLTGLMCGPRHPRSLFSQDGGGATQPWHGEELDFFDAKGVVEELLRHLHIEGAEWVKADAPLFHPGRAAMLRAGRRELGMVGELHPAVVAEWGIPTSRVAAWDLDVEALIESVPERHMYNQISPYMPVRQDMAFVVPADMPAARLAAGIKRAGGANVLDVTLFDIYTGQQVGEGQQSMAFAVTFNSTEKLLTEEDVARVRQRIARTLERELGAKLRG